MKLLIDNQDGNGAHDYTDEVSPEGPITLRRELNRPTVLECDLFISTGPLPVRLGRVTVSQDNGMVLFTGYLSRTPELLYAGEDSTGAVYFRRLLATSDEWILDREGRRFVGESYSLDGAALLTSLTNRSDPGRLTTASAAKILTLGSFLTSPTKSWSENAGAIASASCASYRVLGGSINLVPFGGQNYVFSSLLNNLQQAGLRLSEANDISNDVTVSGETEADAYVTEVFLGDGSTSIFPLARVPYRGFHTSRGVVLDETFQANWLEGGNWLVSDSGSHLSAGSTGLLLTGGDGLDGDTTLAFSDGVELGGGLVLEANAVALNQGSDGVLLGLYSGSTSRANCTAGFDVRQTNGTTTVGALVAGAPVGVLQTLQSGTQYLLRIRVHCVRVQRVRQTYNVFVDGGLQSFGGDLVAAPLSIVFELRQVGVSSNTPVTVLYDGTLPNSPASAQFVPVNSVQLNGSVGSLLLKQTGTAWIRSTPNGGTTATRLIGVAGEGADCSVSNTGVISFFTGRQPAASEQVVVSYRSSTRAVARLQQGSSIASEARGELTGLSIWQGSVLDPVTRSSEDCANAASAILAVASDAAGALTGEYSGEDLPDIWPGDTLSFGGGQAATSVLARSTVLTQVAGAPEILKTTVRFANAWAENPSLKLSDTLASDIVSGVPVLPGASATVSDLAGLTVVGVTGEVLTLDMGTAPPNGGGFEVRRRDGGFGPGADADLVLRSPVRGFSIPRATQIEEYYVRAYDASSPPMYSWRSAAVLTNVPVGT